MNYKNFVFRPALIAAAVLFGTASFANGTFQSIRGDVRAQAGGMQPEFVPVNGRFLPGTTVTTGPQSRAVIRLDDGNMLVLGESSALRLDTYRYSRTTPTDNVLGLTLLAGTVRSVSGSIGSSNPPGFSLTTQAAIIGIHGTDIDVATTGDQTFMSVTQGAASMTNAAGTIPVSAGGTGVVTGSSLGASIPSSQLPVSVAGSFNALDSIQLAGAGAGAGAGGAAAAAGGISLTTLGIIGLGAVIGAAVAGGAGNGGTTGTTGTTR